MKEKVEIEKPKDKWARIIFIPLVGFLSTLLFERQRIATQDNFIYINILISIFSTFVLWQGNRFIVVLLRNKFPQYNEVVMRLFWQVILCALFSLIASNGIFMGLMKLFPSAPLCNSDRVFMSQFSLIITFLIIAIYESTFFFGKWKLALIHAEELKRQSIVSQFETLKSQVNPHFLFNSLNTLSALIEENPSVAVRFVEQLSQVYRYVLQSREKELVDLKTELEFTGSYIFLLQNRFEKNLQIQLHVDEKYYSKSIAPLCIQMLIENAIKHNIVSAEKPLLIEIDTLGEDYIFVKNNVQLKNFSGNNNGLGLPNIINRYNYLTNKEVIIEETDFFYKVALPLI